ncbi:MAG: flagellar assembly protein FliW [Methylococcaceae bacterium]|jgi:flagellar assembly factor FliW|nr:flagellar assembly protein FliW [Methylococcaceae bacterium]MDZ4155550.1 flagellar assembly protein FliW [Methylococcales bacterium]MDP2395273.1 flagellar assembly protein FliW [Methylococcaceae bacterium]MDP3020615.1 flagellar assembly protein FliW [Methylococcaceae bacterium]MDP3390054.1 flagellar assembly protein FliW [Methylococcaceae bacterium]
MKIKSSLLGEQVIDPNSIIHFPNGIPGFEDQTRFKLFHQENNPIIFWLQSLDDELLTFSVASPALFNINYNLTLTDEEEQTLALDNAEDIIVLILLHKDEDSQSPQQPTIKGSIKAPLIINSAKRIGLQKVLSNVEQSITLVETGNEIDVSEGV